MAVDFDRHYDEAGRYWNVDPNVLRAVHQVEDPQDDPRARSKAGAIGHMQFMPDTARRLGIDPTDPVQSIYGAARLLDENIKRYGNLPDALRAYNGGTNRAKWGNPETMAYPRKVAANYQTQKQSAPDAGEDAFGAMFGSRSPTKAEVPKTAPSDDAFNAVFGNSDGQKLEKHEPEQSGLSKAWTVTNDTVNAAGREIDRTFGAGVPHLLSWAASAGHRYDNAASRALHDAGDFVARHEDMDEATRTGDYGSGVSNTVGTLAGAVLSTELGGRAIRPAASALEGNRAGRIASNVLKGDGPFVTRIANNALAAGAQTGLAGGDGAQAAELGGILAAGIPVAGKVISPLMQKGGNALTGGARRIGDYLDPSGVSRETPAPSGASGVTSGADDAASISAQKAEEKAQSKALRGVGAFTDPKKAADAIINAFTSPTGTRIYEAQTPGVFHTKATRTQDVKLAALEDNLRDLHPEAFRALDEANDHAYTTHVRGTIGTPEQIEKLMQERQAFEQQHREAAFANEQPVSGGALHDILNENIEASRGNAPVKAALAKARDYLADATDEDGTALPSNLWNVRKAIGYGLQQASASESAHMRAAASRLSPFMDDLAHHIEEGAPGFRDYLDGYAQRSSDIDSKRFLQSKGLMQASNESPTGETVNYTALKKLIGQLDKNEVSVSRKGTDAVTPEQEAALRSAYRDMLAERETRAAGRSSGASKTFKAAMTQRAKEVRGGTGGALLAPLGGALGGQEIGALAGGAIGSALHAGNALLGHALTNRRLTNANKIDQEVINRLLHP